LYQAQLSTENSSENWVPLKASAGKLSVIGAVSLHPVATKRSQFISIGIHPVPNEHGSNVLYEEINRIISNSSYGVEEQMEILGGDGQDGTAKDEYYQKDRFTSQELKGRKGVDRWPMFYIKIHVGESTSFVTSQELDVILEERQGNLMAIVDILKAMVYEFLKKYHFRPKRIRNAREEIPNRNSRPASSGRSLASSYGPNTASTIGYRKPELVGDLITTQLSTRSDGGPYSRPRSPFDIWTRIKSGSPRHVLRDAKVDKQLAGDEYPASRTPEYDIDDSISACPLFRPDGSLLRPPFAKIDTIDNGAVQEQQSVGASKRHLEDDIQWANPVTKETLTINPRTGFVIQPLSNDTAEGSVKGDTIRCRRLLLHKKATPKGDRSAWLEELLSSWENPVFKTTEPCIPSALSEKNGIDLPAQPFGYSTWVRRSLEVRPSIQGRVSRAALRNAEVIAQVDRKFIFAKVAIDSNAHELTIPLLTASTLIIVDQHAADERCRVESLMKDYFMHIDHKDFSDISGSSSDPMSEASLARTELLERPINLDLSIQDAAQFERAATHFAYWGIQYHIVPPPQAGIAGHRQVKVTRLPPSIAERCRLEPRLLVELLREEAWRVNEYDLHNTKKFNLKHPSLNDEVSTPHWITRFHGCPKGILDMLNSRACRSSIMFNDLLSREECANLLKRLADCAFPFQCAHGRPSMVPLVDLGDNTGDTPNKEQPADSFSKMFSTWNADREPIR
jgi:DNA mismatch repair protein MLH3